MFYIYTKYTESKQTIRNLYKLHLENRSTLFLAMESVTCCIDSNPRQLSILDRFVFFYLE